MRYSSFELNSIGEGYTILAISIGVTLFILFISSFWYNPKKKNILVMSVVLIIYTLVAYYGGKVYISQKRAEYLSQFNECQINGHSYEALEGFENKTKYEIVSVVNDSLIEGKLESNKTETSIQSILIHYSRKTEITNGSLTQKDLYKFMYKTSDGGFKPDSVPVEKTTVYFTKDGETPHIDRVHVYYNVVKCTICGQEQYRDYITYNLYVPEGSIAEEFNLLN